VDMFGLNRQREWKPPLHETSLFMMPKQSESKKSPLKLLGTQANGAVDDNRETPDLLVRGLVDRLPKPGSSWSLDDRAKWLQAAASIFGLVYSSSVDEHGELSIVLVKHQAADSHCET
jgi:hypothetical protein